MHTGPGLSLDVDSIINPSRTAPTLRTAKDKVLGFMPESKLQQQILLEIVP